MCPRELLEALAAVLVRGFAFYEGGGGGVGEDGFVGGLELFQCAFARVLGLESGEDGFGCGGGGGAEAVEGVVEVEEVVFCRAEIVEGGYGEGLLGLGLGQF